MDDSGKNDVVTMTGLLIADSGWNGLLQSWLDGRRELTEEWGVRKHVELHATDLTKGGRGRYCENDEQDRAFSPEYVRARAVNILLRGLGTCDQLTVTTVAARTSSSATAYAHFIKHVDRWAAKNDTQVMIVLDGQELPIDTTDTTETEVRNQWDRAYRNAVHYRNVHRQLDLPGRRIIEDPVLHDSRSSQLVQAADLTAFAAYEYLWGEREVWPQGGRNGRPRAALIKAHHRLAERWLPDSDNGIHWADLNSR
ncbi:DUF3800 domain-containing protein [Actinoplanes sp. NPDC051494]|uniref:DUF3800 domain-containing protein n=1 Tax=Actinoplanes sp. NPDC051494 TaxID=3363907 RepID=UPI0037879928